MYRIYNREIEKNITFKNLEEVKKFLINEFSNNKNKIERNIIYNNVNYFYYEMTPPERERHPGETIEVLYYKYDINQKGISKYLILIFNNNKLWISETRATSGAKNKACLMIIKNL